MSIGQFVITTNFPIRRGCRLKADRRLRYLLSCHCTSAKMQRALSLLLRLPLLQEVIHNSSSYIFYCLKVLRVPRDPKDIILFT